MSVAGPGLGCRVTHLISSDVERHHAHVQVYTGYPGCSSPPLRSPVGLSDECVSRWPFLDNYNYIDAIVSDNEMHMWLTPIWTELLCITVDSPMTPLLRPPKEQDLRPDRWKEPTITWHPPVLLETGTSSYKDATKIYEACKRDGKAKKRVVCGDMATFIRLWWLKAKFPEKYKDEVSVMVMIEVRVRRLVEALC